MGIRILLTSLSAFAFMAALPRHFPQEVRDGTGSWDADTLGNHRAVLHVADKADAVWAHIPWRRRDLEPEKKNLIISDEAGRKVANLLRVNINRAFGDVVFQATDAGTYYLPFVSKSRSCPVVIYPQPENTADPLWVKDVEAAMLRSDRRLPQASLVEFQAIDEFNNFYPMEVIATAEETGSLLIVS
jgi:hypothetical protein